MNTPSVDLPEVRSRLGWVDYAKGICMIGVVTLYAVNQLKMSGSTGWLGYWADFAKPFRMPDFFLLSGLFLGRVIDRSWRIYFDKKVIHYLYFFAIWTFIIFIARTASLQLGFFHGRTDAGSLGYKLIEPYAMLWFIQLLPVLFIVTRLLKGVPAWVLIPIAAVLQMFPPETIKPSIIINFCDRFVFFYIGYRFAPIFFALAKQAQNRRTFAYVGLASWIIINEALVLKGYAGMRGVSLLLGVAGAMGVITTGALLQGVRGTTWLRYIGQNSLVIYLGFYLPMLFALAVAQHVNGFRLDPGTLGFLIALFSALAPLCLFWITRGTKLSFLFSRPAWSRFHLPSPQPIPSALEVPD